MRLNNNLDYILNLIHADKLLVDEYINSSKQANYFKVSDIKKRNGRRTIHEPKGDALQSIYKNLYEELKPYRAMVHDAAHGFIKDRSNATNAAMHLQAMIVFNVDVENFFGNIAVEQVKSTFLRLGMSELVADTLAKLCTVDGVLPQGVNTSPDISNHCVYDMDVALTEYALKEGLVYTRYADDMTFSSNARVIKAIEIESIIEGFGFKVVEEKKKTQKRGSNQYVTGLTIFDGVMPRVSKKYKHRLRLELHLIDKFGIDDFIIKANSLAEAPKAEDELEIWRATLNKLGDKKLEQIEGRINYINGIEPLRANEFRSLLEKIYEKRKEER